jgi:hypothetical protein
MKKELRNKLRVLSTRRVTDGGRAPVVAATTPANGTSVSGSVEVLEALVSENVDIIFGYPGGAIMLSMMPYTIIVIAYSTYWFAMSRAQFTLHKVMRVCLVNVVSCLQQAVRVQQIL